MIPFTNSNPHHQLTQYLLLLILFVTLTISSAGPVTMVVTVTAAPSSPSSPSYLSPSEFKNAVLSLTNTYRTQHNAVSLVWNDTLVTYAKDWAQKCMWKHSVSPFLHSHTPIYISKLTTTERPLRRKPRLRLSQRLSRRQRLGRGGPKIQLPHTHGLHRGNRALHTTGMESHDRSRLRGCRLRLRSSFP